CSFAAPLRQAVPRRHWRSERHSIRSRFSVSARLAPWRILQRHANGINALSNSAQAPPRSNSRVSATFAESETWHDLDPASHSQVSMLNLRCFRQFARVTDPHHPPALNDVVAICYTGQSFHILVDN